MMPDVEYHNEDHARTVCSEALDILSPDSEKQKDIVTIAACFHDTGHSNGGYENHEQRSVEIVEDVLADAGFDSSFIRRVTKAIYGTVFLQEPETYEGEVLSDADVWSFGADWDVFKREAENVHSEFAPETDFDEFFWFRAKALRRHTYYTDEGVKKYQKQKLKNIDKLESIYGPAEDAPELFK
jgi:predicted metal-dependent HD superfamily phosphohydrolase